LLLPWRRIRKKKEKKEDELKEAGVEESRRNGSTFLA